MTATDRPVIVVWMQLQDDFVTAVKMTKRFATWEDAEEFGASVDPATAEWARVLPTAADEAVSRTRGYEYQSGVWCGSSKWGAIMLKRGRWMPYRETAS